jgi:hypothetical protein
MLATSEEVFFSWGLWGFFAFLFYFVSILRVFLSKPTSKQGYWQGLEKETLDRFVPRAL